MKKLILILSILLTVLSCQKDPILVEPDICADQINDYSTAYFFEDAVQLAYNQIKTDTNHIGHNQMELDKKTLNFYLSKLSTIYNASNATTGPMREMLSKWNIHISTYTDLTTFSVKFEDSLGLFLELQEKLGNTSNSFLNELYNKWNFTNIELKLYSATARMTSTNRYNIQYIARRLYEIEEVLIVQDYTYYVDGPSIVHFPYADYDIFIFEYEWKDSGPDPKLSHFWEIKIDHNCVVTLEKEYGDALPS